MRARNPTPEAPLVLCKRYRSLEECNRVLKFVSRHCRLRGPAQPCDGFRAQCVELVAAVGPRDVDIFGTHRLGVVMREERRVLVATAAHGLEPACEVGGQPRAPGL